MFSIISLAFGIHCTSQLQTLEFLPSGKVTSKDSEGVRAFLSSGEGHQPLICKTAQEQMGAAQESVPYIHAAEGKHKKMRCKAAQKPRNPARDFTQPPYTGYIICKIHLHDYQIGQL